MTTPGAGPPPGTSPGVRTVAFALLMGGVSWGIALSSALRGDDWGDALLWAVLGAACLLTAAPRRSTPGKGV